MSETTGSGTGADVAAAVHAWDTAMRAIPDLDAWVEAALQGQRDARQVAGSEPRCTVARAHLVSEGQVAADQRVAAAATAALVGAGDLLLADDALGVAYLGAEWTTSPFAPELRRDPCYPQQLVIGRLDGIAHEDGLTVFEFNGGLPGGMADTDAASAMMRGWPGHAAVAARQEIRSWALVDAAVAAIVSAWHGFGGSGPPFMVLAMPDEVAAQAAVVHLPGIVAGVERAGLELVIADPGRLAHRGHRLVLDDDRPVDLVVRGFYTSMIAYLGQRLAGLFSAVATGDVPMVTSLRSGVYGHKALFAVITDPEFDLDVPPAELDLARAHMPWTRLARPGSTTDAGGSRIDLGEHVLADQASLVLKPVAGFGGAGVVLGWESTPEQWQSAWAGAVKSGGHIVQRRVDIPQVTYPALRPGLPDVAYSADHNPVLCNRAISGYFTRLSARGSLTNITAGAGTLTPTFVLA